MAVVVVVVVVALVVISFALVVSLVVSFCFFLCPFGFCCGFLVWFLLVVFSCFCLLFHHVFASWFLLFVAGAVVDHQFSDPFARVGMK